jgi:hypothetical protein
MHYNGIKLCFVFRVAELVGGTTFVFFEIVSRNVCI